MLMINLILILLVGGLVGVHAVAALWLSMYRAMVALAVVGC